MSKLFKTLGAIWLIGGFIGGVIVYIIMEGNWLTGITWLISGAISGALFYTVGEIHEIVLENNALLREVLHRLPEQPGDQKPSLGNSRANLSGLKGYKMNAKDEQR
ncbi:hypothetical protein [Paenibacillus solani]|uniref:Uncharacterized protein n=1 Tax=Paenibacillus solani TaxID=1705565 RepID=A0A0M1NK34_9BACL|nr:hypothetical protein [Paenibacillus solani]KOR82457.1 hypothetical protein AM231_19250 [Paenibacillus solani]